MPLAEYGSTLLMVHDCISRLLCLDIEKLNCLRAELEEERCSVLVCGVFIVLFLAPAARSEASKDFVLSRVRYNDRT